MKIELIYYDGCPNTRRARANISAAIRLAGVQADVFEWVQGDPTAPGYIRTFASPTVLVDGRDVTGRDGPTAAAACRADGAPAVAAIHAALTITRRPIPLRSAD